MTKNEKKNKHMTLDDRIEIQECLSKGMTFKAIGKRIGKSPTTISREVKTHLKAHINGYVKTTDVCPQLMKAPFACNGCEKRSRSICKFQRQIYEAKRAQAEYEAVLVDSRTGITLNKEDFYKTEEIISSAVRGGQHIYHAIKANDLPVSVATVYRHIHKKYYSISLLDLPRAVKFKPIKATGTEVIPKWARDGRRFEDFLQYMEDNSDIPLVQLDTVLGRIGGKVIMTLHFVNSDFMIGLLLDNKTAAEASGKIINLKSTLKNAGFTFGTLAPVLLTDNGENSAMFSLLKMT